MAVKILRPQFSADPGFAARFKQEARSAGGLSHPNIVSVYDYGTDIADGEQYIVMELVEGRDLSTILRDRGALSLDDAVRIAIGVASALEVAHRKGIVHRDVKPGNILITDAGDVKVTDFGIARAVSEASMTVTGTTLGSVHYFSPEQARGDEVTGASDVYALGIVLFEMLTGRRPFEGDSAAAVALKRLNEDRADPDRHRPSPTGRARVDRHARAVPRSGRSVPRCRRLRRGAAGLAPEPGRRSATPQSVRRRASPPTPPAGEPTVYVPPRVTRPADRVPIAPPAVALRAVSDAERGRRQPWWMWLLALLGRDPARRHRFPRRPAARRARRADSPQPSVAQVDRPRTAMTSRWPRCARGRGTLDSRSTTEDEASDDVDEGRRHSLRPGQRQQVDEGATVTAFVSERRRGGRGAAPARTDRGRGPRSRSTESASQVGAIDREPDPDDPKGSVIRSDPAEGVDVRAGSQVDLVVSSGPTPSPTPSPTPVPTPDPDADTDPRRRRRLPDAESRRPRRTP